MTDQRPGNFEAFKEFEHNGWDKVSHSYHDSIERITRQAAQPLLDAVEAGSGVRLLDVACGTGYVAALATSQGAATIGLDFVASMVDEAKKLHPSTEFREGDAEALPFPDESFNAVVCSFGILHFPHSEWAIAEVHRVLVPGGRFAFTVWYPPEKSPYFANFLGAVETYGDMNVPLPPGPPFFRYGDLDECRRTLLAYGFSDATFTALPLIVKLDDEREVLEPLYRGSVRSRNLLLAQQEDVRIRIEQAAIEGARQYRHGDTIEIPIPALLAAARKP